MASRYPRSTTASLVMQGESACVGLNVAHDPTLWYNQMRSGIAYEGWLPVGAVVTTRRATAGRCNHF